MIALRGRDDVVACGIVVVAILIATSLSASSHENHVAWSSSPDGDQAVYQYISPNCSLKLIVFRSGVNSGVASISRTCVLNFTEQVGLLSVLFAKAKLDGELRAIHTISWGGIASNAVQNRLASAAIASKTWTSFAKGKVKGDFNYNIPLVAVLLNRSSAFVEFTTVMEAMGFKVSVASTEGVLVDRVKDVESLKKSALPSTDMVPYYAHVWFRIEPINEHR